MPRPSAVSTLSVQQLRSILDSRERELGVLERKRAALQRRIDAVDARIAAIGGRGGGGRRGARSWRRAQNVKSLADVMEDILTKSGAPMRVSDIVDAVQASGYRSNSANFRSLVNQMLIKDKRFTSPKRAFYALKK